MPKLIHYVLLSALLTWLCLLVASLIRARAWTPAGMLVAFGNRENLSAPSALAGRAQRTASNTLENFVLFTAVALSVHALRPGNAMAEQGAAIFFWARVAYVPVYYAGIPYLRTGIWGVSIAGLAMMLKSLH